MCHVCSLAVVGNQKLCVTVSERVHTKFYVVTVQAHMFTDMHV